MSDHPPGLDEPDRRAGDRRLHTQELLIRLDERVAMLIERIDNVAPQLEAMRADVERVDKRSLENQHTVNRHENMISWGMRIVGTILIGAVLYAAGVGGVG